VCTFKAVRVGGDLRNVGVSTPTDEFVAAASDALLTDITRQHGVRPPRLLQRALSRLPGQPRGAPIEDIPRARRGYRIARNDNPPNPAVEGAIEAVPPAAGARPRNPNRAVR
jgi:hypothetical protein